MADDLPWNSILAAARAGADWTQYVRVKDARTYAASGSAARQHFQWQSSIIPTSLLTPHDANDRTSAAAYAAAAVKLHKKILVLSGERSSRRSLLDNFRALELLVRPDAADVAAAGGNALPDLREELYFQLIKQLEDNPRAESEAILWRLLCFACVSVVLDRSVNSPVHVTAAATARNLMPASAARTPHLALVHVVGFLLSRQESAAAGAARGDARPAAVLSYASYALRALELLQDPSLAAAPIFDDDLYAFLSHPPVAVDVLHPDGTVMIGAFPVRASLTVAELCAVVAGAVGLVAPGTPAASTSAVGDAWRLFYRFTSHAAAAPPLPPGHVPPLGATPVPPPPSAVLAVPVGSGGFAVPLEQFLRPRLLAAPQLLALLAAEHGGTQPAAAAATGEAQAALTVAKVLAEIRAAAARGQALGQAQRTAVLVLKRRVYVSPFTPPVFRVTHSAALGTAPPPPAPPSSAAMVRSALAFPATTGGAERGLGQPVDTLHLSPLLIAPGPGAEGGGARPYPVPCAPFRAGSVRERALLFAQVCTDWLHGVPVAQTASGGGGGSRGFDPAIALDDRHAALQAWMEDVLRGAPGGDGGSAVTALRDTVLAAVSVVAAGRPSELDDIALGRSDLLEALAPPSLSAPALVGSGPLRSTPHAQLASEVAAVLRDPGVCARLLSAGAGSARGSPGGGEPWLYDAVLSALHRSPLFCAHQTPAVLHADVQWPRVPAGTGAGQAVSDVAASAQAALDAAGLAAKAHWDRQQQQQQGGEGPTRGRAASTAGSNLPPPQPCILALSAAGVSVLVPSPPPVAGSALSPQPLLLLLASVPFSHVRTSQFAEGVLTVDIYAAPPPPPPREAGPLHGAEEGGGGEAEDRADTPLRTLVLTLAPLWGPASPAPKIDNLAALLEDVRDAWLKLAPACLAALLPPPPHPGASGVLVSIPASAGRAPCRLSLDFRTRPLAALLARSTAASDAAAHDALSKPPPPPQPSRLPPRPRALSSASSVATAPYSQQPSPSPRGSTGSASYYDDRDPPGEAVAEAVPPPPREGMRRFGSFRA